MLYKFQNFFKDKDISKGIIMISHIAQVIICIIAILGYIYTVKPMYQNQLLNEVLLRKELDIDTLEKEQENLLDQNEQLVSEQNNLKTSNDHLQYNLNELEGEKHSLEKQVNELVNEQTVLIDQKENLIDQNEKLLSEQSKLKTSNDQFQRSLGELEEEKQSLEIQINELVNEQTELIDQNLALKSRNRELTAAFNTVERQRENNAYQLLLNDFFDKVQSYSNRNNLETYSLLEETNNSLIEEYSKGHYQVLLNMINEYEYLSLDVTADDINSFKTDIIKLIEDNKDYLQNVNKHIENELTQILNSYRSDINELNNEFAVKIENIKSRQYTEEYNYSENIKELDKKIYQAEKESDITRLEYDLILKKYDLRERYISELSNITATHMTPFECLNRIYSKNMDDEISNLFQDFFSE